MKKVILILVILLMVFTAAGIAQVESDTTSKTIGDVEIDPFDIVIGLIAISFLAVCISHFHARKRGY